MIIRNLESDAELMRFIKNAEAFGHKIDCVITAFTHQLDPRAEYNINAKVPFYAIDIKNPHYSRRQMQRRGVPDSVIKTLLECPIDTKNGLVPYGFNRMNVVIEAILRGADILFFVDSDVSPSVLKITAGKPELEEADFFGTHLKHLNAGSQITTGEYSGYNILPPASFDGMDDLLTGVQKADMLEYWNTSNTHRSLVLQPETADPKPCSKILGGNSAIKLSAFAKLPPLFSSHYKLGDEIFLCRGEDTMFGLKIAEKEIVCTDIGFHPLHDTYGSYPAEPDLQNDPAVQNRFYYACTGWVGRNPLLNHLHGSDLQATREHQRECLDRGLRALAGYTLNRRFLNITKNFDASWDSLGRYINEYEQISDVWEEFKERMDFK